MDHRLRIREYLKRNIGQSMADDEDIFSTGLVNSLFALQLVDFIQNEFKVTVDNEDLDLDNFLSVDAMDSFVTRKLGSVAA
ncbi:Phosphopantetheine attachment site [Lysobacter silvestris]|uniref:Phosphopantetheine attachment site n=2 Tax=Solilutibacter silvestris TaxID=1645665 RepID=A0A2K1Q0D5_9GAMM|nr:phosphopantetheine-binding protein [Lysobacter silvestris]PNS08377.1 Phosphopantetheine attachment site [Lysobacter silvestris]